MRESPLAAPAPALRLATASACMRVCERVLLGRSSAGAMQPHCTHTHTPPPTSWLEVGSLPV